MDCFPKRLGKKVIIHSINKAGRRVTKFSELGHGLSKSSIAVDPDYPRPKLIGLPPQLFRDRGRVGVKEVREMHDQV